ncbi:MAG: bifunctional DNA primase/polymerase [Terracidiphilus sp.]
MGSSPASPTILKNQLFTKSFCYQEASSDEAQIRAWWAEYPRANPGIALEAHPKSAQ